MECAIEDFPSIFSRSLCVLDGMMSITSVFLAITLASTAGLGIASSFLIYIKRRDFVAAASGAGLVFVFCFIAAVTGYITGNSRTNVTGDVLPILLSGLGGLFVLGVVNGKIDNLLVSCGTFGFTVALFFGITFGGLNRSESDSEEYGRRLTEAEKLISLQTENQAQFLSDLREVLKSAPTTSGGNTSSEIDWEDFIQRWGQPQLAPSYQATPNYCLGTTDPKMRAIFGCDRIGVSPGLGAQPPLFNFDYTKPLNPFPLPSIGQ